MKVYGKVFVLPKGNGDHRLIADAVEGNAFMDANAFNLPFQLSPLLHGDCYGAKLDLSSAYMHFKISENFK